MLKNISPLISPELLKALCEPGHGDEFTIADGNFPCYGICDNVIREAVTAEPNFWKL